jgi:TonB family protein
MGTETVFCKRTSMLDRLLLCKSTHISRIRRLLAHQPKAEISADAWQPSCNFRSRSYPLREGAVMRSRPSIAVLVLAMFLGRSFAVIATASAQENSAEASRRKIRTRVVPEYPSLAKQMNVSGKVKIEASVAADGHVLTTKVIGGSPLLINSALEALKKWRFEPAPRDTTEIVEFEFNPQGN